MAKIFSQAQMDEIYAYFKDKMNSLQCVRVPTLKPFDECTWNEVAEISQAYYNGLYTLSDIQDVWKTGQSLELTISAMPQKPSYIQSYDNGYYTATFQSQTVEMMIIDFAHDDLHSTINGKEKALITLHTKNCLNLTDYFYTYEYWFPFSSCSRFQWCNQTIKAALPSSIASLIKSVDKEYQSAWNRQDTTTAQADIFVPTMKEMGATAPLDTISFFVGGTPYAHYTTDASRIKKVGENNAIYWTASTKSGNYRDGDRGYQLAVKADGSFNAFVENKNNKAGHTFAFCI